MNNQKRIVIVLRETGGRGDLVLESRDIQVMAAAHP
jgi:hypothetical protein